MKLFFVRHGESECNLTWEFSNRLQMHGLTEKGICQAHDLANTFDAGSAWRIYSSPILRARQTAEIVAGHLGLQVEFVDQLREYDVGILEGRSDKDSWQIYYDVIKDWVERGDYDAKIEEGESFNDVRARFVPFITALANGGGSDVICVGHGGTFNLMLPLVFNLDPKFGMQQQMGHTTVVVAEKGESGLVAVRWGDLTL